MKEHLIQIPSFVKLFAAAKSIELRSDLTLLARRIQRIYNIARNIRQLHKVAFFWICGIWILHKSPQESLAFAPMACGRIDSTSEELRWKVNIWKALNFKSRTLPCMQSNKQNQPAIPQSLRTMTCHHSIQAVTVALLVYLIRFVRKAHVMSRACLRTDYASRNLTKQSKPSGAGSFENRYSL